MSWKFDRIPENKRSDIKHQYWNSPDFKKLGEIIDQYFVAPVGWRNGCTGCGSTKEKLILWFEWAIKNKHL